jgi:homoserine dehydrogenase
MKHKIALVGFGTVGRGLAEILSSKREYLMTTYGFDCDIVAVNDLNLGCVYDPDGLDVGALLAAAEKGERFPGTQQNWDAVEMIGETNATAVCELAFTDLTTGEPAISHCRAALQRGKHVVTSNKGPAALAYQEMAALAAENGCRFLIEGTVMSGTPVLNLAEGPLAGCEISAAKGILNGTTNYILTQMEGGMAYGAALKQAQEFGYAEADPTGDVEGHDARGKVTILANVVMRAPLAISDVSCQGITQITPEDIARAKDEGKRWKLIGSVARKGDGIAASVAPEMVPLTHPLAGIPGATNAITFTTDLLGDVTVVGPGAGKKETGYSILTDLLSLPR